MGGPSVWPQHLDEGSLSLAVLTGLVVPAGATGGSEAGRRAPRGWAALTVPWDDPPIRVHAGKQCARRPLLHPVTGAPAA